LKTKVRLPSGDARMEYPKMTPEELAAKYLMPALRARIAESLIETHKLSQKEAARRLGVTQAAISQYLRGRRALWRSLLVDETVLSAADSLAAEISAGNLDQYALTRRMSLLMEYILRHRLACLIHKEQEPGLDIGQCHICDERDVTHATQLLAISRGLDGVPEKGEDVE
jgi:predicted transcriptional regulator